MDPRRLSLAIACAVLVAGIVVLLALAQRSPPPAQAAKACGKPLPGIPLLRFDLPARYPSSVAKLQKLGNPRKDGDLALALTAAEYNTGHAVAARHDLTIAAAHFGGDDTRIIVAGAMLSWSRANANDVARTLEGIADNAPTTDGLPLVERGIVSIWQGCNADAASWLEQAKSAAPDGFYGVLADDLLHPNQNSNYPPFISSIALPGGSIAVRKRDAVAHPNSAELELAYAIALQGVGRRSAAHAAAEQAIADDPTNLDAQVAAIVLGYDKDAPSVSVGALGGLIKQNPTAISPVLHLGVLLLWIHQTSLAEGEFAKAVGLDPTSRDGRFAKAFLSELKRSKG